MIRNLSRLYGKLNLRAKLILMHLLVLGFAITIIAVFVFVQISGAIEERYTAALTSSIDQLSSNLSYRLQLAFDTAQVTAWDADLERIARYVPEDYPVEQQVRDVRTLRSLLTNASTLDHVYDVRLFLENEVIHTRERQRVFAMSDIEEPELLSLLSESSATASWSSPYRREDGTLVVSCARPIRDPDYVFRDLGFVVLDVPVDFFRETFRQNDFLVNAGSVALVSRSDQVIARVRDLPEFRFETVVDARGNPAGTPNLATRYRVIERELLHPVGWAVVAAIQVSSFREERLSFVALFAGVLAVAGFLSVFFIVRLSRHVSSRLAALTPLVAGQKIEPETDDVEDPYDDEITELKRYLASLIRKNSDLVREVFDEKIAEQRAEMRALQVQVNPHFLYNTLDAISWTAAEEGALEAGEMIGLLARFYRNSLHNGYDLATVSEELEHVAVFVEIYRHRLGDALGFRADVSSQLRSCRIPRLTLQPLVENAIHYGVQQCPDQRGTVRLTGKIDGADGVLVVEDDGPGLTPDHLSEVLESENEGFAIKNVDRRIKAAFGEPYGLTFDFTAESGTKAVVRIPLTR